MKPAPKNTRAEKLVERPNDGPVALLLMVSGAVALVYEIIWQRQFALLFGSAAPATAAVLAGYFAGLGTGAFVIGRFAPRWTRPLRAYAIIELGVGLGALLMAPLLNGFESAYPWLFEALSAHPGSFLVVRTVVVFAVVLLPTFCMGGTLPLLGHLVDRGQRHLGKTAGWLYVANTAGAGFGALSVPFLLLPCLGLTKTIWLSASINGLLALIAWQWDRRGRTSTAQPPATTTVDQEDRQRARHQPPQSSSAVLLGIISGFVTFALQVLWNRAFAQVHENSMYSFSVIVAVIIFALALGAQFARLGLRRGITPTRLLGLTWILAGLAVIVGPGLFLKWSNELSYLSTDGDWASHAFQLTGLATAILLIPMALLGVGLPAIMEHAGRMPGEGAARVLGRLLAANIAGSVAGALAAGFLLPNWLGLWHSILWLGSLVLVAGIGQSIGRENSNQSRKTSLMLAGFWLLSLGPISQLDLPRVRLAAGEDEKLVALTEGSHGITAVVERPHSRRLKLNNHYGLGGTASTGDERMQAHLPLLLHPAPHQVAFLGLGTGITAGGALFHPVEQVTVMELVPEVVTAARSYFREANHGVLEDTRTHVVADDARHYLRGSNVHFDVIVGDLVVPWRQGEGSLFTLEQFTAARDALAPNGIFCQWLPLFQLSEVEVNILTRTFLAVFPHAQVWRGDFSPTEPAIALIGSVGELKLDFAQVQRRLTEMQPDSSNPQLRSADAFWMSYIGDLAITDLPASETRLNREDRPWIELLGPMLHTGGSESALFTGRRLQAWLDAVTRRSRTRWAPLPEQISTAMDAGHVLGEMTLCVSEGDHAGASSAQRRLQQMLPPETITLLFQ